MVHCIGHYMVHCIGHCIVNYIVHCIVVEVGPLGARRGETTSRHDHHRHLPIISQPSPRHLPTISPASPRHLPTISAPSARHLRCGERDHAAAFGWPGRLRGAMPTLNIPTTDILTMDVRTMAILTTAVMLYTPWRVHCSAYSTVARPAYCSTAWACSTLKTPSRVASPRSSQT